MRHLPIALLLLVLGAVGIGLYINESNTNTASSNAYQRVKVSIPSKSFDLAAEVADTQEKRTLGLGGRENIPDHEGMLFVFEKPSQYSFWMKDTLAALDIVWLNEQKQIVHIKSNALPSSYPESFTPPKPALYVLETRANFISEHGLELGDQLIFPEVLAQ